MNSIVVPKSKLAEKKLYYGQYIQEDLFELKLDSKGLDRLWESGIFQKLNYHLELMIDPYEEESITDTELLEKGVEISQLMATENPHNKYLMEVYQLFKKALDYETGIYFYL